MSEGNDGYPTTAMQDTKLSDLASLEGKTGSTIATARNLKIRFRKILAKLKNVDICEDGSKDASEQEPGPGNRLGDVENGVRKIDNEIYDMNAIAETLEDILG